MAGIYYYDMNAPESIDARNFGPGRVYQRGTSAAITLPPEVRSHADIDLDDTFQVIGVSDPTELIFVPKTDSLRLDDSVVDLGDRTVRVATTSHYVTLGTDMLSHLDIGIDDRVELSASKDGTFILRRW